MSQTTVTLRHGLKLGDKPQLEAVLREMTVGIVIDAYADAEKLVLTADGWQLVQSPVMVGVHALRRQIAKVGDIAGPLELSQIKMLHPEDFALLQAAATALDGAAIAALQGVARAGRDHGPQAAG